KSASKELADGLERLVAYHRGSGGQVDPSLTTWLLGLDSNTLAKLKQYGLLPPERFTAGKPLSEHLDDFAAVLTARGNTARHVELVKSRAKKITDGIAAKSFADITAGRVLAFMNDLRTGTKDKPGVAAQTFNFYVQAIKQFAKWAVKERRAIENPVAYLDGLNVRTDRRHDRRALTVD